MAARWSARRALAEYLSTDMADIQEYQPGSHAFKILDGDNGRLYSVVFAGQEGRWAKYINAPTSQKGFGGTDDTAGWDAMPIPWFNEKHPCTIYRQRITFRATGGE